MYAGVVASQERGGGGLSLPLNYAYVAIAASTGYTQAERDYYDWEDTDSSVYTDRFGSMLPFMSDPPPYAFKSEDDGSYTASCEGVFSGVDVGRTYRLRTTHHFYANNTISGEIEFRSADDTPIAALELSEPYDYHTRIRYKDGGLPASGGTIAPYSSGNVRAQLEVTLTPTAIVFTNTRASGYVDDFSIACVGTDVAKIYFNLTANNNTAGNSDTWIMFELLAAA